MDRGEQEKTGGDVGGEHDVKKNENIAINVFLKNRHLCRLILNDKKNYICHARNLKFYLKHGMKLKKIHKILQFEFPKS